MYIELTKIGLICTHGPFEKCSQENTKTIKGKCLIKESDVQLVFEQPPDTDNYTFGVKTVVVFANGEKVHIEEDYVKVKLLVSNAAVHNAGVAQRA